MFAETQQELATRRLRNRPAESECLQRKSTQQDDQNAAYVYVHSQFGFNSKVDWRGRSETPAGSACLGRPRRSAATRRLRNRPAESECLQRKSTQQDDQNAAYAYVHSQFGFNSKVDWRGRSETPAGSACLGRPRRSAATRRLRNRPAESECLQRKSTQQDDQNAAYAYVHSQFGFNSKVDWRGRSETPAGSACLRRPSRMIIALPISNWKQQDESLLHKRKITKNVVSILGRALGAEEL